MSNDYGNVAAPTVFTFVTNGLLQWNLWGGTPGLWPHAGTPGLTKGPGFDDPVNGQAPAFRVANIAYEKSIALPVLQTVWQIGNSFVFTWSATISQIYQIQSTASLAPANWSNSGGILTATNSTMTTFEPIGSNSQQLYRIVLFP